MVADAAGVHYSTVSLALRNNSKIPAVTRLKIQGVAKKLGYTPHPLVSVLLSRVRRRTLGYRGTLAYVHTLPAGHPRLVLDAHVRFLKGARERASSLGFNLEEYHFNSAKVSAKRLVEIWRTRGIAGVIVENIPGGSVGEDRKLPIDLSGLAAASLGLPLAKPQLHYAANDQYMRPYLAAKNLLQLGYRRIGLVLGRDFDAVVSHRCSAGFWAVQEFSAELARVPILWMDPAGLANLSTWLKKHRPDVLLTDSEILPALLDQLGWKIPQDIGWAHLDWIPRMKGLRGFMPTASGRERPAWSWCSRRFTGEKPVSRKMR